jgi:hypothetical protein
MTRITTTYETPSPVHPHVYGDRRECYPAELLATSRNRFADALRAMTPEAMHAAAVAVFPYLPEELQARIRAANDPDAVDCDTPQVSEWQDARNSRPLPY